MNDATNRSESETLVAEMQAVRAADVLHATPITRMHELPKGPTLPVGRIGEMVRTRLAKG